MIVSREKLKKNEALVMMVVWKVKVFCKCVNFRRNGSRMLTSWWNCCFSRLAEEAQQDSAAESVRIADGHRRQYRRRRREAAGAGGATAGRRSWSPRKATRLFPWRFMDVAAPFSIVFFCYRIDWEANSFNAPHCHAPLAQEISGKEISGLNWYPIGLVVSSSCP